MHVHETGARRIGIVVVVVTGAMLLEIAAGQVFGSMALFAEGWHMSTHAAALGLALAAALYARRHQDGRRIIALGGLMSAGVLAAIAGFVAVESISRLHSPVAIQFDQAIGVAAIGAVVNVTCARVLHHEHPDHNLRGAYLHVLSDGMLSVLSVVALLLGKYAGWVWLDAASALVGSAVIMRWSWTLLRDAGRALSEPIRAGTGSALSAPADSLRSAPGTSGDSRAPAGSGWRP